MVEEEEGEGTARFVDIIQMTPDARTITTQDGLRLTAASTTRDGKKGNLTSYSWSATEYDTPGDVLTERGKARDLAYYYLATAHTTQTIVFKPNVLLPGKTSLPPLLLRLLSQLHGLISNRLDLLPSLRNTASAS